MFKAPVPAKLPHLQTMLQDISQPRKKLANFLDISETTLRNYEKSGSAPRPVMLALFWESSWGQSAAACEATNYGRLMYMQNVSLQRTVKDLNHQIQQLQSLLDLHTNGAANSVFFHVNPTRSAVSPSRSTISKAKSST